MLDNLEEALITSDVGIDTTLKIIKRIEERVARDKYVTTNELNGILKDELLHCLLKMKVLTPRVSRYPTMPSAPT